MRKIQFGCGGNILDGWENHDSDIDISKKLPFDDCSVDFVFAEHLIEHVPHNVGLAFLDECARILKRSGTCRITVPDVGMVLKSCDAEYLKFTGTSTPIWATRKLVTGHGHRAVYTQEVLTLMLTLAGFKGIKKYQPGQSKHKELVGVEGHWKVIGEHINNIESLCMEGTKR